MKAIDGVFQAIGLVPKIKKPPPAMPPVTRDDARDAAARADALARRKGSQADILTGSGGAEAGATGKVMLG